MEKIRCNICDEFISIAAVEQHIKSRSHSVKRKVAEFNEMNAEMKASYQNDTSVVEAWIRNLHNYDFLSTDKT